MGGRIMAFIGAFHWSTGFRATSISALTTLLRGLTPPPVGGYCFVRMERSRLILPCTELQSARGPALPVGSMSMYQYMGRIATGLSAYWLRPKYV